MQTGQASAKPVALRPVGFDRASRNVRAVGFGWAEPPGIPRCPLCLRRRRTRRCCGCRRGPALLTTFTPSPRPHTRPRGPPKKPPDHPAPTSPPGQRQSDSAAGLQVASRTGTGT
eukprot:6720311-Alexandrium_andersonii.AAC.1